MVAEKQRITVSEAAKILGVSPQFIRIAMQQKALDIGTCVKMSSVWTYHICPEKLKNYIGVYGKENEDRCHLRILRKMRLRLTVKL